MNFKSMMLLAASVSLLAACSVTSTDKATKPAEATGGLFGMSKTSDIIVDNAKAFAAKNKVVIGSFKVAFLEEKKGSNKAGSGFGGKSSATMKMTGITPDVMQKITDAAYADFIAQLQARGYTIVDRAALLASPDFAKVNTTPAPLKEEASFFGAAADTTYMTPTGFGPLHFFMGEYGKTGGFGWSNPTMGATKYADASGVSVLSVSYTVDFANTGGHGGRWTMSSSLEVGQGVSVAPGGGVILVGGMGGGTFGANPNGNVKLGQAVSSDVPFGTVVNTSSEAGVAAETALNVVSAVLGAGTNQHRSFEIQADPAKYASVAGTVLQQANAQLIGKMASMK